MVAKTNNIKIAFLGLKTIPAKWGGIETFVQEVATRLASKGYEVTVYSSNSGNKQYARDRGIRVIHIPGTRINRLDPIIRTFLLSLHAVFQKYDLIHLHGYMSYLSIPLLKLFRKKVLITLHGAAWKNISYTKFERTIIKLAALIGVRLSDRVTTVSLPLQKELEKVYKVKILLTPVGANLKAPISSKGILKKFNLKPNNYILFLGRLEKVKRVDWIVSAFRHIHAPINLVLAGDSQDQHYQAYLCELSSRDQRISLTGFVEGELKEELLSKCLFFVLPSVVEGMPVSLLEAMSHRKPCLVSDIPAHKWIIQDYQTGFLFDHDSLDDLILKMRNIVSMPRETLSKIGANAEKFVEANFNWDTTAKLLEDLYFQTVKEKYDYPGHS